MRFTVIIPTHNRARLLTEALESVFAQEEQAFEILVVDDGSTDETPEILRCHGDRVRVLRQENRGPAAARNMGIAHARGDYIAFLDSDDLWFPWTLATYHRAIEEYSKPAFVAGTHVDFHETPDSLPTTAAPFAANRYRDYIEAGAADNVWIGTCAALVRADVLREVGGFVTANVNAEDSDLWLRLGASPVFLHITSPPVFAYRRHAASAVANLPLNFAGMLHLIEQERRGNYPGGEARQIARWKIMTVHTRPLSVACARRGLSQEAWKIYRRTFRWNLQLGRFRYLLALPCLIPWHSVCRRRDST